MVHDFPDTLEQQQDDNLLCWTNSLVQRDVQSNTWRIEVGCTAGGWAIGDHGSDLGDVAEAVSTSTCSPKLTLT